MHVDRLGALLDAVIDDALTAERIVGAVVLVALDGRTIYRAAMGMADREAMLPMRENAIFRLASVTKTIVSAAALVLVERGLLRLDDPITRWIPDFRPKFLGQDATITSRQLLTHTAGFSYGFLNPDSKYDDACVSNGLDQPGLSIEEALDRLASVPLLFEPGTAWQYSLGTDVLGAVLARASGRSLPDLVHRLVTGPTGMVDTGFSVVDNDRLAVAYADGTPRPTRMSDPCDVAAPTGSVRFSPSRILNKNSYPSGGAGMVGTAQDFLAFLEAIRRGGDPILSRPTAIELTASALPEGVQYQEPGWGFSLCAAVRQSAVTPGVSHDPGTWRWGGAYGHDWFVNPLRRLSVVSFTNTALEGSDGMFPIHLRDAIYQALEQPNS